MCLCTNTEVFPSVMCKKRFELIIAKYLKRIRVAPLRWQDVAPLRWRHVSRDDVTITK